jgi:HD-GYP domain-containing protein (c-di-GMP phosphodiesterase class II)
VERGLLSHCLTTAQMAERLGLGGRVCDPLRQVFTRWDGKGVPSGVAGEEIAPGAAWAALAKAVRASSQMRSR